MLTLIRSTAAGKSGTAAVANTFVIKVVVIAINVMTGVIAARNLGPAGRGESIAVTLWPMIVSGAMTLGIPVALVYHGRKNPGQEKELFTTALVVATIIGLLAALIGAFVVIPLTLHGFPRSAIQFAQLMMIFAPQIMAYNVMSALLNIRGEFARSNTLFVASAVSTLSIQLVLVSQHAFNPYSNGLAYFSPAILTTIYIAYRVRHSYKWSRGFRRRTAQLLHYGIRIYGLDLLNTLSGQIDQVIVVTLLSSSSFGIYSTAINITRMLNIVQTSINVVLFPKAARLDPEEAIPLVARAARISFLITSVCAMIFLVVTPFLVPLLYGRAFESAVPITRVLTVEAIVQGVLLVLGQAFMATGRPGLITILQLCGLLTSLPLMFILVPRFGLMGAAVSLLSASILRGILMIGSFPLVLRVPIPPLVPRFEDSRFLFNTLTKR